VKPAQIAGAIALSVVVIGVPLALKRRAAPPIAPEGAAACGEASSSVACAPAPAGTAARALPKLVDLGTTTCAPCKAMLVVVAELEKAYPGELAVEFVNVQTEPEKAEPYGVRVIPTQVFVGADGRELFRHTGYFSTAQIVKKWAELGVPLRGAQPVR
jgi:thioredoxin 1